MLVKEKNFENTMGKGKNALGLKLSKRNVSDLLFNDPEIETLILLFSVFCFPKDKVQYYLTLSQTTNFRLFQTEKVHRRQCQI